MVMRLVKDQRLNQLAWLVHEQWSHQVPLSVRFAAAEAADAIVAEWFKQDALFVAGLRSREPEVGGMRYPEDGN